VISLLNKQAIILMYIRDQKSQRQISKETGVSRDTIKKYIVEYEAKLIEIGKIHKGDDIMRIDLIDEITSKPKYKSTPRQKKALTDEVIERIKFYLKENETKRLSGMSKQQKKKKDIYEALLNDGFDISYPSVVNAVNSIARKAKEAYRGNEKGHVERSVDVIRRKAFSQRVTFSSMDEANKYLEEVLKKLNNTPQPNYSNRTAASMLEEEKEFLLPKMPMYETARVEDLRVDKYCTIMIDSCHYSVPDNYVNAVVHVKYTPIESLYFITPKG
jgi:transposase-like protein